jgi:hypothetical protein
MLDLVSARAMSSLSLTHFVPYLKMRLAVFWQSPESFSADGVDLSLFESLHRLAGGVDSGMYHKDRANLGFFWQPSTRFSEMGRVVPCL